MESRVFLRLELEPAQSYKVTKLQERYVQVFSVGGE